MTYTILSDRTDKLLWDAGAIVVALLVLRALSLTIMRLERRRAVGERQLVRLRRGETVAALVATAIPYIAVIILLASPLLPRTAAALGGSALVLILVGFGPRDAVTLRATRACPVIVLRAGKRVSRDGRQSIGPRLRRTREECT